MENKYLKRRKWVILGAILLVLTLTITGTYALWNYFKVGKNQQLVAGEIYMKYTETSNTINIQDAMPSKTYGDDYFQFTIEGKNTYAKPIWYEIVINWGEEPVGRSERIPDEFIRFRLTEQLPGEGEKEVISEGKYEDFSKGTKIWVNTIAASQTDEIKITYKLYMWVSDEMHLGAGDDASSSDMDMETWNNDAFASVKVTVNGDFTPKELETEKLTTGVATEVLKSKIGTDGIVGVTNDNKQVDSAVGGNIREYRYSGEEVNNYVKLIEKKASGENVEQLWRILGVFKDEITGEEYLKIVRNQYLSAPGNVSAPEKFTIGEVSYIIRDSISPQDVKWNSFDGKSETNDWSKAGLQYWLNSEEDSQGVKGFKSQLSDEAKSMLREEKYYLGAVDYQATEEEIYKQERDVKSCDKEIGPSTNNSQSAIEENIGCRVWAGNSAIWSGEVGLLYPSDVNFSTKNNAEPYSTNWIKEDLIYVRWDTSIWFITPSIESQKDVIQMDDRQFMLESSLVDRKSNVDDVLLYGCGIVLPVLALQPSVNIVAGSGLEDDPYILSLGQ